MCFPFIPRVKLPGPEYPMVLAWHDTENEGQVSDSLWGLRYIPCYIPMWVMCYCGLSGLLYTYVGIFSFFSVLFGPSSTRKQNCENSEKPWLPAFDWPTSPYASRLYCHFLFWHLLDIAWQLAYAVARGWDYFKNTIGLYFDFFLFNRRLKKMHFSNYPHRYGQGLEAQKNAHATYWITAGLMDDDPVRKGLVVRLDVKCPLLVVQCVLLDEVDVVHTCDLHTHIHNTKSQSQKNYYNRHTRITKSCQLN